MSTGWPTSAPAVVGQLLDEESRIDPTAVAVVLPEQVPSPVLILEGERVDRAAQVVLADEGTSLIVDERTLGHGEATLMHWLGRLPVAAGRV